MERKDILKNAIILKKNKKIIDLSNLFTSCIEAASYLHKLKKFDKEIGQFYYKDLLFKLNKDNHYTTNK